VGGSASLRENEAIEGFTWRLRSTAMCFSWGSVGRLTRQRVRKLRRNLQIGWAAESLPRVSLACRRRLKVLDRGGLSDCARSTPALADRSFRPCVTHGCGGDAEVGAFPPGGSPYRPAVEPAGVTVASADSVTEPSPSRGLSASAPPSIPDAPRVRPGCAKPSRGKRQASYVTRVAARSCSAGLFTFPTAVMGISSVNQNVSGTL
jgi:hypothetical protein